MIREKLLPVESYAVFDSFTEKALQDGEEGVEQPASLLHPKLRTGCSAKIDFDDGSFSQTIGW